MDPIAFGAEICQLYEELRSELTRTSVYPAGKYHSIERRMRRLNDLGFDVAEMQLANSPTGNTITFVPKVVDAGHHQRQLLRLPGLDAEENQARRHPQRPRELDGDMGDGGEHSGPNACPDLRLVV